MQAQSPPVPLCTSYFHLLVCHVMLVCLCHTCTEEKECSRDFNEGYKVLVEMDLVILKVRTAPVYILTLNKHLLSYRAVSYNIEYSKYLKTCQIARAGVPVYWELEEKKEDVGQWCRLKKLHCELCFLQQIVVSHFPSLKLGKVPFLCLECSVLVKQAV